VNRTSKRSLLVRPPVPVSTAIMFRNGDEITSPNRHTDLGQVCSI